ncbi:MAG: hypothetical protein KCHDKBKB_00639 [Elusimicrobia bacterium]|nr:hypothetical protein [Elusimicrobiota bacterium]
MLKIEEIKETILKMKNPVGRSRADEIQNYTLDKVIEVLEWLDKTKQE